MLTCAWSSSIDLRRVLRVFFVDVEGDQVTSFVTPDKESLLIDSGWPGNNGRNADRIVAVGKKEGMRKIDYILITHFHNDHSGGLPNLVSRIPVGPVIDHGDNRESTDAPTIQGWHAYQRLLAAKKFQRLTLRPDDKGPVYGIQATVVSSDGALIDHPLPSAGERNPNCAHAEPYPADQAENLQSVKDAGIV
jgi:glyoxylase-like metal-dependent hydrolase (beta-lactamase superfamily II)